jgi:glycosyltransferase involved in cell wall biosynthesis
MKILFDLVSSQPESNSKFHGGSEYTIHLYNELINVVKNNSDIRIDFFYIKSKPLYINKFKNNNINYLPLDNIKDLKTILKEVKYDKFFSALPLRYSKLDLKIDNTEFIFTIHGLRPIEILKDRYEFMYIKNVKDILKFVVRNIFTSLYVKHKKIYIEKLFKFNNIKIITVSQHSKFSIINEFEYLKEDNIYVFYPPFINNQENDKDNLPSFINDYKDKYFLLVSGGIWYKNSWRAIKAFDNLINKFNLNKKMIVTGLSKNLIRRFNKNVKNKNNFIFLSYIKRNHLEALFKNCFAFVYPTLNEGFGYPPVEVMKYKKPVLASSVNSIPQIYEDSILYFNPYSIKEIENRILQITQNKNLYKNLINKSGEKSKEIIKTQKSDQIELISFILKKEV